MIYLVIESNGIKEQEKIIYLSRVFGELFLDSGSTHNVWVTFPTLLFLIIILSMSITEPKKCKQTHCFSYLFYSSNVLSIIYLCFFKQ